MKFSGQIFAKYPTVKFHKNPPNGSRVVPRERTATGAEIHVWMRDNIFFLSDRVIVTRFSLTRRLTRTQLSHVVVWVDLA